MRSQTSIQTLDGAAPPQDVHHLCATGEMADRIRAFPWENTSLGPMSQWPPALVGAIGTMLESCFPTAILWGPEMLQFYNDAYIPLAADKHPSLLGQSTPAQWPESWPVVGSQLEAVLQRGERFYREKVLIPWRRNNVIQDVYWTYSYSPLRLVGGAVGGILIICQDVTGEVLATRERDALAVNLQSVLDSITDGLVVLDKDWRYTYSNEQGARIVGLRPEDLTGAKVWDLFPHAKGTKFYDGCHLAVESGRPVHFEEFYPDPLNRWLECHCYPSERGLSVYFRDSTDRKLAEEAIRRSEERFRTLFDLVPVGVGITDAASGRLLFSNEQMSRITGYTREELKGMTSNDLTHPEDRDENEDFYRSVETGATGEVVMTKRYVRKDGRVVWVRVCVRVIHDPADRTAQLLGTVEDITESRMAQRAIEENEARLTALVDSIPTLAWMAEKDGSVFWYNRRWYEYTGTDAEQMKGWGWQSVHDPAVLPAVLERWNVSLRTGDPFEMVFPLRGADGVFRSFITRVIPVRNAAGEVTRWFGTCTEVDELERTRGQLAAAQERIRVALSNVPLILYTADRDLRCTWIHRPHPKFEVNEIIGRRDDEIDPSGDFTELIDFKRSVMERDMSDRREMTLTIKGVQEVYDTYAEPIHGPDGEVVGVTVAAHDVTRQKLAEETLRKTEKLALAGRLAATIAHEINNPLESVTNLLYILRTSTTDEHARNYASIAEEELARVSQIVTQSLRFHRQSTVPTREKLSTVLDSAAALYEKRISRRTRIERDFSDRSEVQCYSSELRQVFGNLIGNALDAIRGEGTLYLRTREASDPVSGEKGVRVTVGDTGHGMDRQTLQRIAEPFFTTKGTNGTGLGLWISKDILQKHRAKMRVKSRPGPTRSGTVFSIFLPLESRLAPEREP